MCHEWPQLRLPLGKFVTIMIAMGCTENNAPCEREILHLQLLGAHLHQCWASWVSARECALGT